MKTLDLLVLLLGCGIEQFAQLLDFLVVANQFPERFTFFFTFALNLVAVLLGVAAILFALFKGGL